MEITFIENTQLRQRPLDPPLFGTVCTNYMFEMDYTQDKGWHNATIKPYAPITMEPSAMCLHYGQTIFEGAKAILCDDQVVLFRIDANYQRFNLSAMRMMMPTIDVDFAVNATIELLKKDTGWFYEQPSSSIYIRPFMFACESTINAHASSMYKFMIIMSPVASYFAGTKVRLITENHYMRVAKQGTGEAKCGGNYASSFAATALAKEKGFTQVLWLDPIEKKYVEEAGMMNVFFVVDGKIITPITDGSILKGITRDSIIKIAPDLGYEISQERIDISDVVSWYHAGRLTEMFASGTAASVQSIHALVHKECEMVFEVSDESIAHKIACHLDGIKRGLVEDKHHFITRF